MILYIAALLGCLLILTFPGAKGFYKTIKVDTDTLKIDDSSYQLSLPIDRRVFNPESILVVEDGTLLIRAYSDDARYRQEGTFYLNEGTGNEILVSFLPSENIKNPLNQRNFYILIKPNILSGNSIGQVVIVLMAGIVVILGWLYKKTNSFISHRLVGVGKSKPETPNSSGDLKTSTRPQSSRKSLFRAGVDLVILTYFLIFMEWLFFITMPSFMDNFLLVNKIKIFLATSALVTIIAFFFLIFFFILGRVISKFLPEVGKYFTGIPFAFLASSLCFLLLDNFLNTVFSIGVAGSSAPVRILFSFLFMSLFLFLLFKMSDRYSSRNDPGDLRVLRWLALGFLVISLPPIISRIAEKAEIQASPSLTTEYENPPNIVLISSDGLNASNMSLYGYERDTTPFLRELAETSLIGENNFPNSDHSLGSETSLLTGRFPFITGILFSPDILQGSDRFLHLPGILRNAGYRTVSLGVPYYIDANVVNMNDAFDEINCIENGSNLSKPFYFTGSFEQERYLFFQIKKRIVERLLHIFYLRDIKSAISTVNDVSGYTVSDQARLQCLRSYLAEAKRTGQPIFVHMHQMGTHGPMFETSIQRFSHGEKQEQNWMTDFYDDSIINFDSDISTLVEYLKSLGMYQNTIIGIYTDHGTEWTNTRRLPLLIHFPGNQNTGRIHENTQNLDITPTILDYLGMEIPEWMDGSSLLSPLPQNRIIFSVDTIEPVQVSGLWTMPKNTNILPFRQIETMKAIQCQKVTSINLESFTVQESEVDEHTALCSAATLNTRGEIINKMGELLRRAGYRLPEDWKNLNK